VIFETGAVVEYVNVRNVHVSTPTALGGYGGLVAETPDKGPRMDHEQAETPGLPFGELFRDPHHLRGDLRLLRRAIREGWPIPEESRRVLLDRVSAIIDEPEAVPEGIRTRAVFGAAWVVLEADRENLRGVFEALGEPLGDLRVRRVRRYEV
jgi:hypothetical protein